MPTLSKVKVEFTTVGKWLGLFLGAFIGIFILVKGFFLIKEIISPTPLAGPTVSFRKLPPIFFSQGIEKNFTYKLDTISGSLPVFSDRSKVYVMNKIEPDILAVDKASAKVESLGFNLKPEQLSDTLYRWTNENPPFQSLILNVNMAEFSISSAFLTDPNVLSANNLPTQEGAITVAKGFLQTLDLYPIDVDENKIQTRISKIDNGLITEASSFSNAKLITVYFSEKDKDSMPIVYPKGVTTSMNITIAGGPFQPQVIDARFFYQKISDKYGTYPIKTSDQAFEELKKGKAYIASYEDTNLNIVIKKVYLGFYVEGRSQDFLEPVIVFEGNGNFRAYVSAVTDEWISN